MPTNICILPQGLENEADDAPKKFTNIDTEDFVQTWDRMKYIVKAGETTVLPKYLVNRMAANLARKIYKRKAFEVFEGTEIEKRNAAIRFVNPEEEVKIMKLIVAKNFEEKVSDEKPIGQITQESVIDKSLVEKPSETKKVKCDVCNFEAKSEFGLKAHKRIKHQ